MSLNSGLTSVQLSLLVGGTILIANIAAIWFLRRSNLFKSNPSPNDNSKKDEETEESILHVENWNEFELIKKIKVTHNTAIYHFKLPTSESILPLPIGQVL